MSQQAPRATGGFTTVLVDLSSLATNQKAPRLETLNPNWINVRDPLYFLGYAIP